MLLVNGVLKIIIGVLLKTHVAVVIMAVVIITLHQNLIINMIQQLNSKKLLEIIYKDVNKLVRLLKRITMVSMEVTL